MECAQHRLFWISNFYVRIFAGMIPNGYHAEDQRSGKMKLIGSPQYALAVMMLREFDVVIILSQWEEQKIQLLDHGISDTELPRANVNEYKSREPMTEEMREYLESINTFDLGFFDAANKIAQQRTVCAETRHFAP